MSNFYKLVTKYTKSYVKRIEKFDCSDEEKLIFKTIGLMGVNSFIVFIGSLEDANTNYSGIKPKQWRRELKTITEQNLHNVLEAVTDVYFTESAEEEEPTFKNIEEWHTTFRTFMKMQSEEHLVDRVFKEIFLESVNRNEYVVMTFVNIIESLFVRLDVSIQKALNEFQNQKSEE